LENNTLHKPRNTRLRGRFVQKSLPLQKNLVDVQKVMMRD